MAFTEMPKPQLVAQGGNVYVRSPYEMKVGDMYEVERLSSNDTMKIIIERLVTSNNVLVQRKFKAPKVVCLRFYAYHAV